MSCIQKERARDRKDICTIINIPEELWEEIRVLLPKEKPSRTIGRPVIPYRKVLESILYLEQDVSGRGCFPKNMVQVPPVIVDSRNGIKEVFSKRHVKLLKIYDYMIGIDWTWQSIDSISVKSPLGGRKLETILQIEAN